LTKSRHNSVMTICIITKKFNHVIREVNTLRMECMAQGQDKVPTYITINLTKRVILNPTLPPIIWVFLLIIVISSQFINFNFLKTLISIRITN